MFGITSHLKRFRKTASSFFGLVLFLALPGIAFAHAVPTEYLPREGASLREGPSFVRIQFSERVEPGAATITLLNQKGVHVARGGDVGVELRELTLSLREPLAAGLYAVSWRVVSRDDGHFSEGSYSFAVGTTSAPLSQASVDHTATDLEIFFGFLEFLGLALVLGASSLSSSPRYRWTGVIVSILGALGSLVIVFASGDPFSVLMSTRVGFYAVVRFAIIAFLPFLLRFDKRILVFAVLFDSLVRALVSHAAASHFFPEFSIAITALHIFSKEFLVGLMILGTLTQTPVVKSKLFGRLLLLAVPTGAYVVWLHLKFPENLLITPWGFQALVLFVVASCAALLQVAHEWGFEHQWVRKFSRYTIPLAAMFLVGILYFSSVAAFTSPPVGRVVSFVSSSSEDAVTLVVSDKGFLAARSKNGRTDVVATASLEGQGVGPQEILVHPNSEGEFIIPRSYFVPDGTWKLLITTRALGEYDANAEFFVLVPEVFSATSDGEHSIPLGIFLLVGSFIFLLGYFFASSKARDGFPLGVPTWDAWLVAFLLLVQLVYLYGPNPCHHGSC